MIQKAKCGPYDDVSKDKQYLSFDSGRSKYLDEDTQSIGLRNIPDIGNRSGHNLKKSSMMLQANRSMNNSSRPSLKIRGGSSKANLREMIYNQSMSQGGLDFHDYAQSSGVLGNHQKRQTL